MVNSARILLIDDGHLNNKIMKDMLMSYGFKHILTKSNAEEAISYLQYELEHSGKDDTRTELIITSIALTGMTGLELLKFIKLNDKFMAIPVIIVSSIDNPIFLRQAFEYGAIDYILRPCKCDIIVRKIQRIIEAHSKINELSAQNEKSKNQYHKVIEDLNIANQLQRQLLPKSIINGDIEIHGLYMSYDLLGGDLYYWKELANGNYGVILLDVMGHGTATALICMYIRSILPDIFDATNDTKEIINMLNQYMIEFNDQVDGTQFHCTAFLLIVDVHNQSIDYVNAGHPYAAYMKANEDIMWLKEGCIPLGIFKNMNIENQIVPITTDSKLFLYSDGIYELLRNESMDIYYILQYIQIYGQVKSNGQGLLDKVHRLIEQMERNDDVSMVYIDFPKIIEVDYE